MSDVPSPPPARPFRELLPHFVWEGVLLLAAIGVTIALYTGKGERLFETGGFWLPIASLGFAATGMSLSLRTGTPNLAIGPLAQLAAYLYADQNMGIALFAVAAVGLVLALVAGLTGMPGWAVTLLGGLLVQAIVIGADDGKTIVLHDRPDTFWPWGVAFIVLSVAGGVAFAFPPIRRYLSANRPAGGEAGAFSLAKLVGALVGVFGSSVAAALAGVVLTIQLASASPVDTGLTLAALATVLLAGVSPLGRRAGVLGVVFAVVFYAFARYLLLLQNVDSWQLFLAEALVGLFGVLVVCLLELIGRRATPFVVARPGPVLAPGFPAPGALPPPGGYPVPAGGFPAQLPPGYPAQPGSGYAAQPGPGYPAQPASAHPAQPGPGYAAQMPPASPYAPAGPAGPAAPAPPTSAPPSSAPPAYGPPTSAPPEPGPPTSAPPAYGPPPAGIPPLPGSAPPPSSGPSWPPAQ